MFLFLILVLVKKIIICLVFSVCMKMFVQVPLYGRACMRGFLLMLMSALVWYKRFREFFVVVSDKYIRCNCS